jgi:acetyltransferase-like isoleucine patch superfamily enzyme
MTKIILKIFNLLGFEVKRKNSKVLPDWLPYTKIGKNTDIKNLNILLRVKPDVHKFFIKIGGDCVLNGDFIFENQNGQVIIGNNSFIGGGTFICINRIDIGNDVLISWGCTFSDNNSHSTRWTERANDVSDWKKGIDENNIGKYKDWKNVKYAPIKVKDKAWIGFNCIILKGVIIGEGAIVGAGSVVTKNVPDWTIVAGNPARIIREIPEHER